MVSFGTHVVEAGQSLKANLLELLGTDESIFVGVEGFKDCLCYLISLVLVLYVVLKRPIRCNNWLMERVMAYLRFLLRVDVVYTIYSFNLFLVPESVTVRQIE
jgi:hypothetical protein